MLVLLLFLLDRSVIVAVICRIWVSSGGNCWRRPDRCGASRPRAVCVISCGCCGAVVFCSHYVGNGNGVIDAVLCVVFCVFCLSRCCGCDGGWQGLRCLCLGGCGLGVCDIRFVGVRSRCRVRGLVMFGGCLGILLG